LSFKGYYCEQSWSNQFIGALYNIIVFLSKELELIFEMPSCGGCQTCAIACSFKHTGEFNASVSSIKILEKEDGLGFCVHLIDMAGPNEFVCDGCADLNEPMCLQFCEKSEDLKRILQNFFKKKKLSSLSLWTTPEELKNRKN
jgi:Fe-S-cluster-containing hydrogenase component 2